MVLFNSKPKGLVGLHPRPEGRSFTPWLDKAIKKLAKELGFNQLSIQGLIDNKIIEIANAEIIKGLNKSKLNCNYKLSLTIYINPEIYDDDKLLIIKHNIRNYLKTSINLFNNKFTDVLFNKPNQPRVGKNRIKEANKLKELELKKNLNQTIKETKQPELNKSNHIPYKNNHRQSNQITAFKFNLTPEQRDIISLTGVGLDAGIGDEITMNCGELYQSFSLNSRLNEFLLETLAQIKVAQKELSHFNHRSKKLNKQKLNNKAKDKIAINNEIKKVVVNIKGINKPLVKVKSTIIYSRKYQQLKNRLAKLWIKYENIKTNMINHLIGFLKQLNQVNFQNEMINSWHQDKLKGYSKKVQAGILGKVYAKLKLLNITNPEKYRMLGKYHKTTQDCVMCGKANKLKLSDRIYKCSCGYENNRDTHGAFNMILKNDVIENNQSFKNKVFGRNTSNLVQIITSNVSKDNTKNVFDIAGLKLESKSYVKLFFNHTISYTRSLVL